MIDLSGKWEIADSSGEFRWEGEVPGSVLHDLEKLGHLGEKGAFYRDNNRKALSLMQRDYLFNRTFLVNGDFLDEPAPGESRFRLEADGLDTLAEISINGEQVARTDNMHRRYSFDIAPLLKPGENRIEIRFRNSLEYIDGEHKRRPLVSEDEEGVTTVPGFYAMRKSHCSFGWDWGPQMPDAGIWRPIRIVRYDCGRLDNLRVRQHHFNGRVELDISGEGEFWSVCSLSVTGALVSPDGQVYSFNFTPGEKTVISIDAPCLWWPNGMGKSDLYCITANLMHRGRIVQSLFRKIGLRTLTVSREPDKWGESFCFMVNGIPLFARGANYIPEDVYLSRVTPDRTERLLKDCRDAHFNCIRVWGGGVYPSDEFYDLCDRLGLIVWQDLMFACAIYDMANDDFTQNIREEIGDNLRRIRHHASLGLICGNNEMEWFFVDYDTFPQTKENEFEYIKQYHMVIPEVHEKVCPEVFYWPSSPSSGGYFDEPNSPDKGDCHFWAVWHGNKDFTEYRKHYFRFMSEFGFESLPSMKTIESFTDLEDRNVFSPVMEEHQKRVGGNPKIVAYLSKYFRYPGDLSSLVYVSQLSQSDAIRHGVEHWRRNRGRCMGAIYWQLNDNWPVASWSSIDYYGRWKALHYTVSRVYDNILLSAEEAGRGAGIHLSNESGRVTAGELTLRLISLTGEEIESMARRVVVAPRSSEEIIHYELPLLVAPETALLAARYVTDDGGIYESVSFFEIYKYLGLKDPEINTVLSAVGSGAYEIILSCRRPALYVEVDVRDSDLRFSDNYFHLFPGWEKRVCFSSGKSIQEIEDSLLIRSLKDSY